MTGLGSRGEFLAAFEAATGLTAPASASAFGDPGRQADELARLIAVGRKRATAGMLDDYLAAGEALPEVGGPAARARRRPR